MCIDIGNFHKLFLLFFLFQSVVELVVQNADARCRVTHLLL